MPSPTVAFRFLFGVLAVVSADAAAAEAPTADDWTQWRGPNRDCHAPEHAWPQAAGAEASGAEAPGPDALAEQRLTQAWRVELGPSYSGPVVCGGRVFTTETREKRTEVASAYDRRTGEKLWEASWPGAMRVPFFAASNGSWIRATPACDGERLYVAGIRDVVVCLDATNGAEAWRLDFSNEFGTPLPKFGFASSPALWGDHLYVQAGGGFVKVDKRTGETVWRVETGEGGRSSGAFSSPYFAELGGRTLAIVQTRNELKGIDPDGGGVLWSQSIQAFRGMNILTPTTHDGAVFTSAHSGRAQMWAVPDPPAAGPPADPPAGLEQLWVNNKAEAYMSSPVVVGGYLYMHLKNGRIACVDLATGAEAWRSRPYGKYQSMVVLPGVAGGERILSLDQRGDLLLFRATPDAFDLIAKRRISDAEAWAHLAVVPAGEGGAQLFIRELNALAAYSWR
ncbi:MAG: PQQ-binding-like beta-propeller repeat protein [Planctomycetota bacterium]